jgi:hypothetical protein
MWFSYGREPKIGAETLARPNFGTTKPWRDATLADQIPGENRASPTATCPHMQLTADQ